MKERTVIPALLLLALCASGTSAAGAGTQPACPADDRVAMTHGLRAFVDPQTGQLREPTPEEAQALSPTARLELAREIDSLETVVHPDGMMSLDLKGLFVQSVVVRKAPDGTLSMGCVDGPNPSVPANLAPTKKAPVLEEK